MKAETGWSSRAESGGPSTLRKILPWALGVAALTLAAAIIVAVLIYGYRSRPGWVGVSGKKFWDYLELLIVPAVLTIGVTWLNWAQRQRERQAEDAQQKLQLAVEDQRAQDAALQAYLDQMSQLLIDEKLRRDTRGDVVARARTLTILGRLDDGGRKGSILQFLYEAGLIFKDNPLLSLSGADLSDVDLSRASLRWADRLEWSLDEATGETFTFKVKTPSTSVDLSRVNLSEAYLSGARLPGVNLSEANLQEIRLPEADLSNADLRNADLRNARLRGTRLHSVHFGGANLIGADLTNADLQRARLTSFTRRAGPDSADVISEKPAKVHYAQLDKCKSLEGATMPDGKTLRGDPPYYGPTFKEWLERKREEEGENGDSA
jgi:hypothetical protein